jgi:hypothetical protein
MNLKKLAAAVLLFLFSITEIARPHKAGPLPENPSSTAPGGSFPPTTGREIRLDHPGLAAGLGRGDPFLCLRSVLRIE